jgi:hypothetical protein
MQLADTAFLMIFEGQFQVFQRFSSSRLVLKTVRSRFTAIKYYAIGRYPDFRARSAASGHEKLIMYVLVSVR